MDALVWLGVVIFLWFAPIVVGSLIADRKGLSGCGAAFLGFILSWIGVAVVLLMPGKPKKRKCPECAERVMPDARVCRFCGHRFGRSKVTDDW